MTPTNTEELLNDILKSTPHQGLVAQPEARGRGKGSKHLHAEIVRELEPEDLLQASETAVGSTTAPLQELRMSHHKVAKLMASGYKNVDISRMTGYSQSRLSILKNDPAFKELISSYQDIVDDVFAETTELLKHCTDDILAILQERLLDDPDSFTNAQLNEVLKTVADRSGFGPQNKMVHDHNVNFIPPEKIAQLKEEAKELQNGQTRKIAQEKSSSYNQGITHSSDDAEATIIEAEEIEGCES